MNGTQRISVFFVAALFLCSCGGAADDAAEEQLADTAAMFTPGAADASGTWNMRSVPESGGDTTSTIYQFQVSNGSWTLLFPNREPIAASAVADGDSIILDAGPYESVRRAGTMVTTHSVVRITGDQITGTTVARYQTSGADSVLRLNVQGTRAQ